MEEQRNQEQKAEEEQIAATQKREEYRRLREEIMKACSLDGYSEWVEEQEGKRKEETWEAICWLVRGLLVIALCIWAGITLRPYLHFFLRQVFRPLFLALSSFFRNLAAML